MWIFENLWKALAAIAGATAAVLYFLWRVSDAQKETAQVKAANEKAKRKGVEATQAKERDVAEATHEARSEAEEVERENQDARDRGDRNGIGDRRLRDED